MLKYSLLEIIRKTYINGAITLTRKHVDKVGMHRYFDRSGLVPRLRGDGSSIRRWNKMWGRN